MLRLVLDTNVVLSATLFGGKPRLILEAALEGKVQICLSQAMLAELEGVLQRLKFGLSAWLVQTITSELASVAEWTEPKQTIGLIADDPSDNRIIECALEARADYLVTGDSRLLALQECGKTKIVTPDVFMRVLEGEEP